jgi:hypothetical protein
MQAGDEVVDCLAGHVLCDLEATMPLEGSKARFPARDAIESARQELSELAFGHERCDEPLLADGCQEFVEVFARQRLRECGISRNDGIRQRLLTGLQRLNLLFD